MSQQNNFVVTFSSLRRGAAAIEASEKLKDVVKAVQETGKAGKIVIELTIKPNAMNNGEVEAVKLQDKITGKPPVIAGESVLFVNSQCELVANNFNQRTLFPEIEKRPPICEVVDEDGEIIHHEN